MAEAQLVKKVIEVLEEAREERNKTLRDTNMCFALGMLEGLLYVLEKKGENETY